MSVWLQRNSLIVSRALQMFRSMADIPQHLPAFWPSPNPTSSMRHATRVVRAFLLDDEGATLVEYGLLILIIAVLAVVTVRQIGGKVSKGFESINSNMP